ncbi:hypothetical protein LPJ66_000311 [Kickxella alabastrina]|uniref:Uncharacterized protein n=1 Tax=Kickxella alabastrina TaxID=61397 RepID=A0ACC1IWC4_9FUNG|nr:hypothetical protein LPJ66_000311 [Kickxella alabastrina]
MSHFVTIVVLSAIAAFIVPAANASPVFAEYQPTKNTCGGGSVNSDNAYGNAYPYNAGYGSNAYPYGGAYDAYNSYGGASNYGNYGNYGGVGNYGNVGNYGGAGGYGSYTSGFPIALSTVNKLDRDSFAAKYKEDTVYVNNKGASVSKDQINKFDSVNVIA